jgi:dihydroorotase-like cyclic amidohydrolase
LEALLLLLVYQGDIREHRNWEESRPPLWEQKAITLLLELAREDQGVAQPGFQIHIAHMSDTGSLPTIAAAKRDGNPAANSLIYLRLLAVT